MLKPLSVIIFALFAIPAIADDLDDTYAICASHHPAGVSWHPGWEHCQAIWDAKKKRDADRDAVDENKNPDLKKSRDVARKLGASK